MGPVHKKIKKRKNTLEEWTLELQARADLEPILNSQLKTSVKSNSETTKY